MILAHVEVERNTRTAVEDLQTAAIKKGVFI